ncbi:MAG TPA: YceI family protein [Caulobacteraceae bacterium]|jgi:polyisoprenoid-binding protein YceI|nr:YceI family protein [Caulobacteraceae bacterium]
MSRLMISATLGLAFGLAAIAGAPVLAQPPGAPAAPVITKDPMSVPAGVYKIDKEHQSVVARIAHSGFSMSTVRFGVTDGVLNWDPAHIENSKVNVTVSTKAYYAPITYGIDPGAPNLMNAAAFPTATFVSTGIKRTGPTTGQIMGNLTLMGQTKPVTIDASLVGAGKSNRGIPSIGFTGVMKIKRGDFGFNAMQALGQDIEIVLDAEFLPA